MNHCVLHAADRSFRRSAQIAVILALAFPVPAWSAEPLPDVAKRPPAAAAFEFERDVREVLENSCLHCHDAEKHKGGLRLETPELALKGGDERKAIVPGNSAESAALFFTARLVTDMEMPP